MFQYKKLSTKERITKMKIELQEEQPFWSRLIMDLNIQEDTKNVLPDYGGMGVDARGNLFYKKDFVKKLSDSELQFVLAHEVSHCVFHHLLRIGNRNHTKWNIATDIAINTILRENGFVAPLDILMPNSKFEFEFNDTTVTNVNKKLAEQIYDELPTPTTTPKGQSSKEKEDENGQGKKDKENYEGQFDKHIYSKLNEHQKEELQTQWEDKMIDAATFSKMKGNSPLGMDRYIKNILNPKVNWKHLLYKYITNTLPFDFTYSKPSKKSISTGYYMPSIVKETIELVAHIDTSGSISQKELTEFLTEIITITKSFAHVKMTLIECDCAIQQILEVTNGNIEKIINMKIKGGGGTSHKPVWDYIEENIPNCKLLISLTDGYSNIQTLDNPRYEVIFVVCKGGAEDEAFPFGKIIKLD